MKKADDDRAIPNSELNHIDPATIDALHERWEGLRDSINRSHRFDPLASNADPDSIRPWSGPADTSAMRGTDPLTLEVNGTPSGAGGASSVVNEPSVAAVGDYVFYTANWYAAASTDGGENWTFVNPNSGPFPAPDGEIFCCDQQVH
ncbi:MAG: hypothetical protein AAGM22_09925, partial [Acidobacteriota bacterium]